MRLVCTRVKQMPVEQITTRVTKKGVKILTNTSAAVTSAEPIAKRADILFEDFEGADYGKWKSEGEAFGKAPAAEGSVKGMKGKGIASGERGKGGSLTSAPFVIQRKFIKFLISGARFRGNRSVQVLLDGKVVASEIPPGGGLVPKVINVALLQGKTVQLRARRRLTRLLL